MGWWGTGGWLGWLGVNLFTIQVRWRGTLSRSMYERVKRFFIATYHHKTIFLTHAHHRERSDVD